MEKAFVGTNNLAYLTENLLTVSNIETKVVELQKEKVDWVGFVEEIVNKYRSVAAWKDVKISFEKPETKLPTLVVDKFRIGQVLDNLLSNAVDFNKQKGKVTISVKVEGKELITSVKDTGIGIPVSQQEHVFRKFFRGSNAMKLVTEGSGLGLAIVHRILKNHNGNIEVESETGKGSIFTVTLPVHPVRNKV